jgi:uncharacterized protein (TIGR03067 family)
MGRTRFLLAAAVLVASAVVVGADDKADDDMKRLQGTWTAPTPNDELPISKAGKPKNVRTILVIKDDTITKYKSDDPRHKEVMRFKIVSSKKLKEIDLMSPRNPKEVLLGIYELEGDTFKLCFGEEKRPTEFVDTWKKFKGQRLQVFQREKK